MERTVYQINLLPWRDRLKKEKNDLFIAVSAIISVVVLSVVYLLKLYVDGIVESKNDRITFLNNSIGRLEKELSSIADLDNKKRSLSDRMNIIDKLQQDRPRTVMLFQELVNTLPESGLWLKTLKTENNLIRLEGFADTAGRISAYVNLINRSTLFQNPRIGEIKDAPNSRAVVFTMIIDIKQDEEQQQASPSI